MHQPTQGKPRLLDHAFLETRGFRPEIQGLRALALFLVVSYHIWFGRVSGGVDVFLFISAFLLSLSSMRKINEGKPLAPVRYWMHVFQRLLPAAATVVAATVVASYVFLAPSRLLSIIQDGIATLFYYLNWRLAFNSVDYYAQDAAAKTPLQHFWSLSMQGQIFILWPLLFVLVAYLAHRLRLNLIGSATLVFGSIFVGSLTFSVIETATRQGFAYFDTRTRLWEFAAGTLLAFLTFKWKAPRWARVPMGWLGVIGLISCGFVLPVEQAFPGYLALWPLISGALVILAGQTGSPYGVDRILSSKPLLALGEISYALYLVHWPVFVIYSARSHTEHPDFLTGTGLILLSMVVAWAIHRFIEQPLRKTKPTTEKVSTLPWARAKVVPNLVWKPLLVIGTCLVLVGVPLAMGKNWVQNRNAQMAILAETGAGTADFPGAYSLVEERNNYSYPPIPASDPFAQFDGLDTGTCTDISVVDDIFAHDCGLEMNGALDAPLMMVIGGSHAGQSISWYRELASENGINLMDLHTGGCRFPLEAETAPTDACVDYNRGIVSEVLAQQPAYLALMVTQTDPVTSQEILVPGIEEKIEEFTQAGIRVIGLRDNPRWSYNVYDCAQVSFDHPEECSQPVQQKLALDNPARGLIGSNPLVFGLDFTQQLCPEGRCLPIIGNIYVYMDDNHISKAYGSTLVDSATAQLDAQGWLNPPEQEDEPIAEDTGEPTPEDDSIDENAGEEDQQSEFEEVPLTL